jgi:amino-acid N-acetyltransferase
MGNGIKTLYLLTMTAADFFLKIGYQVTQKDKVPKSIEKTEEFKNVCPVSAACLCKALDSAQHLSGIKAKTGHLRSDL